MSYNVWPVNARVIDLCKRFVTKRVGVVVMLNPSV